MQAETQLINVPSSVQLSPSFKRQLTVETLSAFGNRERIAAIRMVCEVALLRMLAHSEKVLQNGLIPSFNHPALSITNLGSFCIEIEFYVNNGFVIALTFYIRPTDGPPPPPPGDGSSAMFVGDFHDSSDVVGVKRCGSVCDKADFAFYLVDSSAHPESVRIFHDAEHSFASSLDESPSRTVLSIRNAKSLHLSDNYSTVFRAEPSTVCADRINPFVISACSLQLSEKLADMDVQR